MYRRVSRRETTCSNGVGSGVNTGGGVGVRRGWKVVSVEGVAVSPGARVIETVARGVGDAAATSGASTARPLATRYAVMNPAVTATASTTAVAANQGSVARRRAFGVGSGTSAE